MSASASATYLASNTVGAGTTQEQLIAAASIASYTTAFWWAAGFFAAGAVISALLYRNEIPQFDPTADRVMAH